MIRLPEFHFIPYFADQAVQAADRVHSFAENKPASGVHEIFSLSLQDPETGEIDIQSLHIDFSNPGERNLLDGINRAAEMASRSRNPGPRLMDLMSWVVRLE